MTNDTIKELLRCALCPRRCAVNRQDGARGYCGAGAEAKVFRWGPHFGEEPPVSGTKGSGTIFFSHCTLGCLYCQNYPWSAGGAGEVVGTDGLARIFQDLAAAGCHNWNLVTPGPWLPVIKEAAARVKECGISLPFVYNTSGYELVAVAERYRDLFDIVLTDLRYSTVESAQIGSGAPDYVERARDFARWTWEHAGALETDSDGIARRGMIVRILVLPGREAEAIANLEWLAELTDAEAAVSVMSQYTPVYRALETDGWRRAVSEEEYARVTACVERLGFETGWVQEFGAPPPDGLLGRDMPEGGFATGF